MILSAQRSRKTFNHNNILDWTRFPNSPSHRSHYLVFICKTCTPIMPSVFQSFSYSYRIKGHIAKQRSHTSRKRWTNEWKFTSPRAHFWPLSRIRLSLSSTVRPSLYPCWWSGSTIYTAREWFLNATMSRDHTRDFAVDEKWIEREIRIWSETLLLLLYPRFIVCQWNWIWCGIQLMVCMPAGWY